LDFFELTYKLKLETVSLFFPETDCAKVHGNGRQRLPEREPSEWRCEEQRRCQCGNIPLVQHAAQRRGAENTGGENAGSSRSEANLPAAQGATEARAPGQSDEGSIARLSNSDQLTAHMRDTWACLLRLVPLAAAADLFAV
jgi:hypothetical protein